MKKFATSSALLVGVLCAAVAPLPAESMALAEPSVLGDRPAPDREVSQAGWRDELMQWLAGRDPRSGELMAVVLPESPRVTPPPPPPVIPPVVPPPQAVGVGRVDDDQDLGQVAQPPDVPPIPEPSSIALLAVGACALVGGGAFRKKRRESLTKRR